MAEKQDIEIGVERMIDGLFELFDEIGDLALNRVVRLTKELDGGFNPTLVTPGNVNRFKLTWFVALGELMFHEVRGEKVPEAVKAFHEEMRYQANERDEMPFLDEITERVRNAIAADEPYLSEGIFNTPSSNGGGKKNEGLGAILAETLAQVSFEENDALKPIYPAVHTTVEDEFINAYGHSTIACARFVVVDGEPI
ncbi:MAG: hypothetical protein OXH94_12855 [Rhodospirillales bacterium]|nr:hypothetical protein [Rhodospirillales bacterium]